MKCCIKQLLVALYFYSSLCFFSFLGQLRDLVCAVGCSSFVVGCRGGCALKTNVRVL